jgi:hypothetical protein
VGSKSDSKAFGRLLCSRPKAKIFVYTHNVDARQRNERNARVEAAETGWLQVGAHSESADFTGKLNKSTLRLKGNHFVYEKAVPNKPQNKKHSIR